jgi:hypothetical protein
VYDTFVSQFIPPDRGQHFPKAWEILAGISSYVPDVSLLGRTVVLLVLLLGITVEYAYQINRGSKQNFGGDTLSALSRLPAPRRIP